MEPILGSVTLTLSRWQFATTIIFHFFFVPLTIGLGFIVAVLQTAVYRTHDERYEHLLRFFGKLFLINFAIGVVTGIVQEFQFGMNWAQYSAFVGNIFGPPLAIEGLLAFFMESTFLGIWIFGKGKVSDRIHLLSIWMVVLGSSLSAAFILVANSWMQHPVGYKIDHATHQAVMTNFLAIFTNELFLTTLAHVLLASLITGSAVALGIAFYQMKREGSKRVFALGARIALVVFFVASIAMALDGSAQGVVTVKDQPMKMAAAEALYNTKSGAPESLLTIGNLKDQVLFQITLPHVLSLLATNSWNGKVQGINQLQKADVKKYGPGNYVPTVWLEYWNFRIMAGLGAVIIAIAVWGMWLLWRKRLDSSKWFRRVAIYAIPLPFIANTTGWIFTETGRQPWIVYGVLRTSQGVTRNLSPWDVGITFVGFIALYVVLGAVDLAMMLHYSRKDLATINGELPPPDGSSGQEIDSLVY
ncbi:MAG: cytochrome ubiquinol oxidase subunit I [Ferrimicrobium sp.]|jgi:cytochrome d ubiquinol oxidase subunit I|nr:cytochrome ubiquinol oxidase subunit I [Ferrimicrobium sp.]